MSQTTSSIDLEAIARDICRLAQVATEEHVRSINRSQANVLLQRVGQMTRRPQERRRMAS